MEGKKLFPAWVGIVCFVLVICAMGWTVFSMITTVPPDGHVLESQLIHAMILVLLLAALAYCLTGFKKGSAGFFNLVVYLYTVIAFTITLSVRTGPAFLSVISVLSFGILCVFALAKDIGQKKSFILCRINVALSFIRIIVYVITVRQFPGGLFGNLLVSVIFGIMVYAKYADKAARGTN